jgi:hypothetical protein
MKRFQRLFILVVTLLLAALAAFFMRSFVFDNIIAPFSFIWFYLVYYYHVIPQQFYWFLILLAAAYIALSGLMDRPSRRNRKPLIKGKSKGPVESLASWINDSKRGVYSRWRVARALGLLANSILEMRGNKSGRAKTLKGKDWNPPPEIQDYLETGLNGSFADYPLSARKTPFDVDVEAVLTYLESQLEINRGNDK